MEDTIKLLALQNAAKFKGRANPKAIVGGLMKMFPKARDDMPSTIKLIAATVSKVNELSFDDQKKLLLELDPDYNNKQLALREERKERANSLPPLENVVQGKVVTRMPPEPSKYAHLGHAMSFIINYLYAKMYDGKVVLRFDDTNPDKAKQEFVDAMQEDIINYLGAKPDKIVFASEHMEQFYSYAEQFIDKEQAYVCSCPQEDIKLMRREMQDCPHRSQSKEANKELWDQMKSGSLEEGSHVLRLKIDMQHKNAVMRDPVIYRLCYKDHYKMGRKYNVWPMYDFESSVEEGLCGVTHVMRGNEFDTRIELQDFIGNLLGFHKVYFKHYGRFTVKDATTQGREIRELIASGDYLGWDDPRLVTLRALKRRGIVKESYFELAKKVGLSKQLTTLDFSVIAAINRSLLDKSAKRFFGVKDPVIISVSDIPDSLKEFKLSFNPNEDKGERVLSVSKEYYIEKSDFDNCQEGVVLRFIDSMNLRKIDNTVFEFVSESYDDFRSLDEKGALIHFVPKDGLEVHAEILLPDTSKIPIIIEPAIKQLVVDEVMQFERFAFCRLDKQSDRPLFWFTHE